MRYMNVAALAAVGVMIFGCSEADTPAEITDEPAVARVGDVTATITTARIVPSGVDAWVIEWGQNISCESASGGVPVGGIGVNLVVPRDVQSGDALEIVPWRTQEGEAAWMSADLREEAGITTQTFSQGRVVVDAWGPEGATVRVRASTGDVSVEGAISAVVCPE